MQLKKPIIGIVLLAALAVGGYYYWQWRMAPSPAAAAGATKGGARGGPGGGPTPVVATAATQGDIDVIVNGLGTVTPLRTVTVKSRVDGELVRVLFDEGQLVKEGQLLAEIDPRPYQVQLQQAEGQLARDRALLENAKLDLERYNTLFQQDSIAKQQVDTQASLVRQYEGALRVDASQVENARLQLAYARITAPVSGRLGLRQVDPGNIVHAGDPNGIVVITQVQPIAVLFTIPADHLPQVLQQTRAGRSLTVEAYDRDMKNRIAHGSLLAVDNQIDSGTGTVRLKAVFDNEDNALYSNQFVNARLLVDTLRGTVLIPSAAIQRGPQSTYVYVVKKDGTVDMRNVDVQLTEGDDTAIRKGVAPGETVVVDGVDKLQPGMKVALASATPRGSAGPGGSASPRGSRKPKS